MLREMVSLMKLFLWTLGVCFVVQGQNIIDICECDQTGSLSGECGTDRQCDCKPGVGGLQCDQCLPGYTAFSAEGCRLLDECQCHPQGSLSDCNLNGVCNCRLGIQGDKCDTCQDGFHRIDLGCIPCPTCFDQVSIQFMLTLELYNNLLQRLNDTLSSNTTTGLTPDLIEEIDMYRILLTDLLQRAINATGREQDLTSDLAEFNIEIDDLMGDLDSYDVNITRADETIDLLSLQANRTQSLLQQLTSLVRLLERRVNVDLRMQLTDLLTLNEQLTRQFDELVRLATEANGASLSQQSQADNLLLQATDTLSNVTSSIQSLQEAINIQNQVVQIFEMIQNETIPRLEILYLEGTSALSEAEVNVPIALEDSIRILETILGIVLPQYNLNERQETLSQLRNETTSLFTSITQLDLRLEILLTNFSTYNETANRLLSESEALNNEAEELLAIAEEALLSANYSVTVGNEIIREARRLLMEIQNRLSEGREFTTGLETVIRNIELAESLSLQAENETTVKARELMEAMRAANMAASFLENASVDLANAFQVATNASISANQLLSDAQSLNDTATSFASNISQASSNVDQLEDTVRNDTDSITMVTDTANETISVAAGLTARLLVINDVLVNLTQELEGIALISPERILNINSTLTSFEEDAASNQILVNSLTVQVRQLQESADELRLRYTQVQQHRDLLQDILRNVEDLNCREQFEN